MKANNELVSIIIPVYNVEKYIEKCIKSIMNQSYKNIEIIIVDDGSPDNSKYIIEELQNEDKRIKLISQKNSGVSIARNNGIKTASGKYIIFVDADDYLSSEYVEYMLSLITQDDCDFAYSIKNYWFNGEEQTTKLFKKVIYSDESSGLLLSPDVTVGCWNKIYKKCFLIKNNLYFRDDLYYGEGLNFIIRASLMANKIGIGNKKVYYYRKNNMTSATTRYNNDKYHNGLKSLKIIGNLIDLENDYVKSMYVLHLSTFYLGAIVQMIMNKKKKEFSNDYKIWKNSLKVNLGFILKNKYITNYRKCMLLVGCYCPPLIALLDVKRRKKIINNSFD